MPGGTGIASRGKATNVIKDAKKGAQGSWPETVFGARKVRGGSVSGGL